MKMLDKDVLFKFKLRYPWKKTLMGGDAITISLFLLAFFLSWYSFIYRSNPPKYDWFWLSFVSYVLILVGLDLAMRYILIHGDKIKAPIEVWVTEEGWGFRKGMRSREFGFRNIARVRHIMNDEKVMIDVDYREKVGTEIGWRMAFRRKDEFASNEDYHKFVKEKWIHMAKFVIERIKYYNPDVEIIEEDRRRKYR